MERGISKKEGPRKSKTIPDSARHKPARITKDRRSEEKVKTLKNDPETPFIVCPRRKSRPMMAPFVCEKRCKYLKVCSAYYAYVQPGLFEKSIFSPKRAVRPKR